MMTTKTVEQEQAKVARLRDEYFRLSRDIEAVTATMVRRALDVTDNFVVLEINKLRSLVAKRQRCSEEYAILIKKKSCGG